MVGYSESVLGKGERITMVCKTEVRLEVKLDSSLQWLQNILLGKGYGAFGGWGIYLSISMAYGTRRFNAAFTRALQ